MAIVDLSKKNNPMLIYNLLEDRRLCVCINLNKVSHFLECRDRNVPEMYDEDGGKAFGTIVVMENGDKFNIERQFMDFCKDMDF
tara:strand:+ start:646 stop:897 length:252 start_codon:yes stop_codon:yes gene_type:complete